MTPEIWVPIALSLGSYLIHAYQAWRPSQPSQPQLGDGHLLKLLLGGGRLPEPSPQPNPQPHPAPQVDVNALLAMLVSLIQKSQQGGVK